MKNFSESYVLEPSTNTHKLISTQKIVGKELPNGSIMLKIEGEGLVTHGEHGVMKTESSFVMKTNQMEFHPVQKAFTRVWD
jgi:hypothetical protein